MCEKPDVLMFIFMQVMAFLKHAKVRDHPLMQIEKKRTN